ncbi:MAG: hypothetical protein K2X35_09785 [Bryobacteraceae bacterium]|nr:hypothetical protein [Bryobacteraceae bacterium]
MYQNLIRIATLSLTLAPLFAQDAQDKPREHRRGGGIHRGLDHLDLTNDQKQKLQPVLEEQRKQMMALRDDTNLTPQDRRRRMGEIRDAFLAKARPILTEEQLKKMEEMRGKRGGRTPGR